ncbi:hypothetical protein [Flavobacterium sp.]|jgi:hypothetical protein|uniref:hypothetical protein n=1 Tax=Flavobacterium sp. TaxID=239 RepID=UPI0037C06656
MKKVENLKSDLFKKFEGNKFENLNMILGGDPGTSKETDCSETKSDCTGTSCDTTSWSNDSSASGDTIRSSDGCNEPTKSVSLG